MNDADRYPRMLFRGDETSRADSHDEMLAKRAQGWRATLLPGESAADIGDEAESEPKGHSLGSPEPSEVDADIVKPRRGRPKKLVE